MSLGFLAQFLGPGLAHPAGLGVLHLALLPVNKRKRAQESILLRDWEGSHGCSVCFEELIVVKKGESYLPSEGWKETRLRGEMNSQNLATFKLNGHL